MRAMLTRILDLLRNRTPAGDVVMLPDGGTRPATKVLPGARPNPGQ
jgi:hypothetical protein